MSYGDLQEASQTQHLPFIIFYNDCVTYVNKWYNHLSMTQPNHKIYILPCLEPLYPIGHYFPFYNIL